MVFPIGDENPHREHVAYVNIGLVAINVAVFLYMIFLSPLRLEAFVFRFGAIPLEIVHGQNLYSLLTSQFLHAGWLHIASNMLFLWIFGDNIERVLGHALYAGFYLGAGVLAGLAHVAFNSTSVIPSIGASGAIAAVLGTYIVLFPVRQVRVLVLVLVTRVAAFVFLGVWALLQLFSGILALGVETAQSGGVAVWAHVGGFVVGLVAGAAARGAGWRARG